jgi:exonuclease III
LLNKLKNAEFRQLVSETDIVFLTECGYTKNFEKSDIDVCGYESLVVRRERCKCGDLLLLYKSSLKAYVTIQKTAYDSVIWLKICRQLFGESDLYICCVYIPAEGSVFYNRYDCDMYLSILDDHAHFSKLGSVCLVGDTNSRAGTVDDFVQATCEIANTQLLNKLRAFITYDNDKPLQSRKSQDSTVNSMGRKLIEVCKATGLRILNGRTTGDKFGKLTFQNSNGTSVIDYALISENALHRVADFSVADFNEFSDHAPITVILTCASVIPTRTCSDHCASTYIKWNVDDRETIINLVNAHSDRLTQAVDSVQPTCESINEALLNFTNALSDITSSCCTKTRRGQCENCAQTSAPTTRTEDKPWFNDKCRTLYKAYRSVLRCFNRTRSNADRVKLAAAKRVYKREEQRLKRIYQRHEGNMLSLMKRTNPRQFYKLFNKRNKRMPNNLSTTDFYDFFKQLMQGENTSSNASGDEQQASTARFDELDKDFDANEILNEISRLKRDKSPGADGLLNEMFINCADILHPMLLKLFNAILKSGYFPESWSSGIIIPVFKKGDVSDVNNYRGITLVSHVAKLFTSILNRRLLDWAEKYNVISDAQFGFKPGFGTVDAIMALQALIQRTLNSKQRLYCCFVDYTKAFDSVVHYKLWQRLIECGLGESKVLTLLKSLYCKVQSCVRVANQYSDYFPCNIGLMQGEALSPLLFSMFVNELETKLSNDFCPAYELRELALFLLMYADDTVLFSDSVEGLQAMLNSLHTYSTEMGLTVNIDKTKVVVFRNGGRVRDNEVWSYNNSVLDIVNIFRYLGLVLNYNGKFNVTQKAVAVQGNKALHGLLKQISDKCFNIETQLQLFDTYVGSVLNYGCEVWGHHKAQEIERVHLQFCKRLIGVKKSTSNMTVYNELGRFPLSLGRRVQAVKYWTKLLTTDNCILKTIYQDMFEMCVKTPHKQLNWLSCIRDDLCAVGMGDVWRQQCISDTRGILVEFRQRIQDNFLQSVDSHIRDSAKCVLYRHLTDYMCLQPYLAKPIPYMCKKMIAKYRLSSHLLKIETGRFVRTIRNMRLCEQCDTTHLIEDEFHFILVCPRYTHLRETLIKPYYYVKPSMYKLVQLFSSVNVKELTNLGKFLQRASEMRGTEGH